MAPFLSSSIPLLLLSFLPLLSLSFSTVDQPYKTYIIRIDSQSKPSIFPTHYNWYTTEFTSTPQILHTYDTVFHGFSAILTPDRAATLSQHPSVLAVIEDQRKQLHTTRSPQFLGLRNQRGLWSDSNYGSDVIIGVLDTGIWPERRSFSDVNLGPVPGRWKGICEVGERFTARHEAVGGAMGPISPINDTLEFKSPRDADGHGTHTASTAAGRHAFRASMEGFAAGIAKGVAPKARLAVYKVCWKNAGCFDSDILAAFDAAVKDGVDVISISIGGGNGISAPYYLDPIAIGAYGAASRGVFVSSSAGNDGPNFMSVTNLAPWIVTVGAGTIDRSFPAVVVLGNGKKLSGVSLYAGLPLSGKMYPLVYPGVSNGEGLVGDAHLIPACALGSDEGDAVKAYVSSTSNPVATISFKGTVIGIKPAPVVASFSGRGPNGISPEILKPDLIAPGVNILAAWTDAAGPTGLESDPRKTEFNILSGTSMACPHVSGAAALLKSAHPDWSPAAIRSAMMTTANTFNNLNQPMTDEATGAGHLNLDRAMDPGLVYDITNYDYVNFLCGIGYGPRVIQVITRSPVSCPVKKPLPENLNYPSLAALFSSSAKGASSKTFIRTVTNVGQPNAVYRFTIQAPKGVTVTVKPRKLVFTEAVKKRSFIVTITANTRNLSMGDSGAVFGSISWSDGKHVVRSPIVVAQMDPL
ncbi:subtilisin-like protease SBT1.6 [Populus alba x Populus x berolinensis]|uniref:Subtilisin-like protease SBT1.6 n=1 Tax=Populus alba x Populus x berolinensis TaxID=444605 RepID=A0AAD6QCE9_9ROSI|nr:subtilisin-like protease SBT1.6 [Populus alba x Populus x berolinensis]